MEKLDIRCLISGEKTGGKISVFEEKVGLKAGPPLHTHEQQLEIFHVISGHLEFEIEGERFDVPSGGTAIIPPGKAHAFINRSKEDTLIHFELLPSGSSETFFSKLVSGEFEDLPKLFEDHGLKLMGPPIQ